MVTEEHVEVRQHHRERQHTHLIDGDYARKERGRGTHRHRRERSRSRDHSAESRSAIFDSDDNPEKHAILISEHQDSASSDPYGRFSKPWQERRKQQEFKEIVSDHPFGVTTFPSALGSSCTGNDQITLQFWSWTATLYVLEKPEKPGREQLGVGLARCDVADRAGDWCGSAVVGDKWLKDHAGKPVMFIALSEAKCFSSKECLNWTQYIPKD